MEDSSSERTRRVSVTKLQRATAAGAELIALCQTVTADGRLTAEEVAGLRDWLRANKDADLPAISFLHETLERILADGLVTRVEVNELYRTIEAVLPPDIRDSVRGTRRVAELQDLRVRSSGRGPRRCRVPSALPSRLAGHAAEAQIR